MSSRSLGILVVALAIIIFVLAWFLFVTPAAAPVTSPQATSTNEAILPSPTTATDSTGSPQASSTQPAPLDTQVVVTTPQQNATVSHKFEVAGLAPNQWFYEAVFPIQVRDSNDDLIGTAQGQAQGDWTKPGLVTFTSEVTVQSSYEGSANLILLRDNPSGLPQNVDEVTIPITVQ